MSKRPVGREEATGYLYVFFQSADYPMNPSYITYDTDAMTWSDPVTLPMTLHEQEDGIYNASPQALYYNDKVYLFGRGPDGLVVAMTMSLDGTVISDPITLNDRAFNAVTPYVWNDSFYLFFQGADDRVYCSHYTPDLGWLYRWMSPYNHCTAPLTVLTGDRQSTELEENIQIYYQDASNGTLSSLYFSELGFPPDYIQTDIGLINGPCVMPFQSSYRKFVFYRNRTDSSLWVYDASGYSMSIDGIDNLSAGPSAILFDDGNGHNYDCAVFYVQPNGKLKVAGIRGIPSYPPVFNVVTIQDTGATLAGPGCSPFALAIR